MSQIDLDFNPKPSTILHLDLNSCFATIEQQANPLLRGKPIAVAAYDSPGGCIIAPSIEAKALGVRVGMRVKEGKMLCPGLLIKQPDSVKYRTVHLQLKKLLATYTDRITPKSIDEFELDLEGYPAYEKGMLLLGREIKNRILAEIGDWLTVSVGIGPNRFLAKVAANLEKPDGLNEINKNNYLEIYSRLNLVDLPGIARQNSARLTHAGIHSVLGMSQASVADLKVAFHSINAYYWYLRLRGWEIDDVEFGRKSFGNSYALPKPYVQAHELTPLLMKLVEKMCYRLRSNGYACQGVHYSVLFRDGTHWHRGVKTTTVLFSTSEIYAVVYRLFNQCPYKKPVRILAVSVFNLRDKQSLQLDIFETTLKKEKLYTALDRINERWGRYVITPAKMMAAANDVHDRVAFGGVREIEQQIIT